ncbi:MAG: hypothetical protein D6682_07215 [Zetaproteobacteria bacterium]|nr:MAG: hypothetical protein D6682_07215 [Zetaproteobacteria bacterium]
MADRRLLRVLAGQLEGALNLLKESSEDGLIKLSGALDEQPGEAVEFQIMEALTDLQNIDRVSQRLHNVRSCLADWAEHASAPEGEAPWKDVVAARYVMEEEREVLRREL